MTTNAGPKWTCDYCTFENWPASKKCTLCRAARRPQYITEDVPPPATEQDIYKMAAVVSPSRENTGHTGAMSPTRQRSETSSAKWPCQVCTYLNWPKSVKCIQCLSQRPKVIPVISTTDHTKPLSINVNIEGAGIGYGTRNSPRTSPSTSPNSPDAAKAINNDKNRAVSSVVRTSKWTCKACTFDNWPKSVKCTVCGVARGKLNQESPQGSRSNSNENLAAASLDGLRRSGRRRSPPSCVRSSDHSIEIQQLGGATAASSSNMNCDNMRKDTKIQVEDRKLRQFRNRLRDVDWLWLNACQGVVEGDSHSVEAYLAAGGDPARQLTQDESSFLSRPSAFQSGYTLVHLAIRFQREDMLAALLTSADMVTKAKKRMPSHVSPDIASEILRQISSSLRQRKGDFPCYFLSDIATFALPADIEDLPRPIQKQLFDEILDRDVQKELEVEEPIVNWSLEMTDRLGSRLYALWNRTAGDCLLDSALQATWGIFDRDNTLRRALADSLMEGANTFYPRWKETEGLHVQSLQFSLDENQWQQDWGILISLASQPGAALEQIHVFALAHILRRPIIVYGIKFVKSFRGENIDLARFQGVYLPLLWEPSFCWKSPITLGYTRGHFSALVAMEVDMDENIGAGANIQSDNSDVQMVYLPLIDSEGKLLPVHFLSASETGREESIVKEWMDVCQTDSGLLVAKMTITKRPGLVRHMLDEWMDRYRRMAQLMQSNQKGRGSQNLSSEEETDDE